MITRFAKGVFTDSYKKTIGTDFMEKEIFINEFGENVKLMLWDTAGQEMFSQLTKQYYKGFPSVLLIRSALIVRCSNVQVLAQWPMYFLQQIASRSWR